LRRTSALLLVCVPLIDVVLLAATVVDLRRGATPEIGHGLAAAYIGFTVAFGHTTIRWADERFAHRFAGGPPPRRPDRSGWAGVRYEWKLFGQAVLGWLVACALLGGGYLLVDDPDRARPLLDWVGRLAVIVVFWFIFGPLFEMVFPSRSKRATTADR
jgi:hypothetical protein